MGRASPRSTRQGTLARHPPAQSATISDQTRPSALESIRQETKDMTRALRLLTAATEREAGNEADWSGDELRQPQWHRSRSLRARPRAWLRMRSSKTLHTAAGTGTKSLQVQAERSLSQS